MYEMILADENDRPVPPGVPGQALVRPVEPYAVMLGYWRKPEATVEAWRNLWFHTGDVLVENPDGTFVYLDRIKDSIRRRGENISSLEVEQGVLAHPDVSEVAAFGVQTDHLEDEVMVVVSLLPGRELTAAQLHEWLEPRMPAFMVPRYVEIVAELPKTPTSKIKKDVLRKDGVLTTTWDHQAETSGATR
jgi:crotonobetaine/carnitine-CoA ligase